MKKCCRHNESHQAHYIEVLTDPEAHNEVVYGSQSLRIPFQGAHIATLGCGDTQPETIMLISMWLSLQVKVY